MKTLWTPWRMEHVKNDTPEEGCIFCSKLPAKHNKEQLVLFNDTHTIILLNRFPYANGHLLVAPRKHTDCISTLNESEGQSLFKKVQQSTSILKTTLECHGINIGLNIGEDAGAGIADHVHFHLVPRWRGDHNFMTVLNDVRTIPEHIENTYDALLPHFMSLTK